MKGTITLVDAEQIGPQLERNLRIDVLMNDGSKKEAKVLLFFQSDYGTKEYVTYTFEEKDKNDLVVLYTSILLEDKNGEKQLADIESEDEWKQIKDFMRREISLGREE